MSLSILRGSTSIQAVVHVPELLRMIFSCMDRHSNVINACVCKNWSSIALDIVWQDVDNLLQLLSLLGPINSGHGYYKFSTLPDANAWFRFQRYAERVRRLHFIADDIELSLRGVFDEIARTRTALDILPNLHTLKWITSEDANMQLAVLFMHKRVKRFIVSLPPNLNTPRLAFFSDISARMPQLTEIDLRIPFSMHHIEDDILVLLHGLPHLRKVVFPECHITSNVATQLSKLPDMRVVQFEWGEDQGIGSLEDVESFEPSLSEGAFPALQDLSLTAAFTDVDRFLNRPFAPTNLTHLFVDSYWTQNPGDLNTLLITLLDNCPLLSELRLYLLRLSSRPITPERQIHFDTIRPLLSFPNLTTFELIHEYPIDIGLPEIEELARNWPSLESLMLNCEPIITEQFTLDLRALLPFARHCPRLLTLGLFLDATTAELPDVTELKPFRSLRTLSVGTSMVQMQAREPVACFLSEICPMGCEVEVGVRWPLRQHSEPWVDNFGELCRSWDSIRDLLPSLIRLRREERERTRILLQEVEDLRIRTRLLTEKRDIKAQDSCIIS